MTTSISRARVRPPASLPRASHDVPAKTLGRAAKKALSNAAVEKKLRAVWDHPGAFKWQLSEVLEKKGPSKTGVTTYTVSMYEDDYSLNVYVRATGGKLKDAWVDVNSLDGG